jgi:hypothetical protein
MPSKTQEEKKEIFIKAERHLIDHARERLYKFN